jgi:hypothetical protein
MKKDCKVKAHRRNGKMVKSHSRTVKAAMKNSGSGMSAEECKAKYDSMVAKYGENSPQAKKLAMKMEGMETVEKAGMDEGSYGKKVKKHSRGGYMRKNVEEELLTKNSRKPKSAQTKADIAYRWKNRGLANAYAAKQKEIKDWSKVKNSTNHKAARKLIIANNKNRPKSVQGW